MFIGKPYKIPAYFLLSFFLFLYSQAYAQQDENFDDETPGGSDNTLYLSDFIINNPEVFPAISNPADYSSYLVDNDNDLVLMSGTTMLPTTQISIESWFSDLFKLNSFAIEVPAGYSTSLVIKGYNGVSVDAFDILDLTNGSTISSSITFNPAAGWNGASGSYGGVLSFNSDWANINKIEISAPSLFVYIDDIDINIPFTPVELTSFTANVLRGTVNLKWETATEINNYGFQIERKQKPGNKCPAGSEWKDIGFVRGNGNSNIPVEYSFSDKASLTGNYLYRLKQIDNNGKFEYSKVAEASIMQPLEFSLNQNYPNPFNPSTNFNFCIVSSGIVTLKIYDLLGNEVAAVLDETREPGEYTIKYDASGLSSGLYLYKLESGGMIQTKKMMLLK